MAEQGAGPGANGWASSGAAPATAGVGATTGEEQQWIDIDLSDLALPADTGSLDQIAAAASHVYERFAPYADEGWEWVHHPADRGFPGWVVQERDGHSVILGARLLSRRAPLQDSTPSSRASHGLSPYRTRQLTGRPWTAEPGSKRWRPLSHH